jgi:probable addiction module antidote protein
LETLEAKESNNMNTRHNNSVSHKEATMQELQNDPEFAAAYLQAALEEMDEPEGYAAAMLALRDIAQARGGLATVAGIAGIQRESLYRALSPKGNPTLKTLQAIFKAVGMRMTVEPRLAYR